MPRVNALKRAPDARKIEGKRRGVHEDILLNYFNGHESEANSGRQQDSSFMGHATIMEVQSQYNLAT